MNALDRLAPLVAGLLVAALIVTGLVYAANEFNAAIAGLS